MQPVFGMAFIPDTAVPTPSEKYSKVWSIRGTSIPSSKEQQFYQSALKKEANFRRKRLSTEVVESSLYNQKFSVEALRPESGYDEFKPSVSFKSTDNFLRGSIKYMKTPTGYKPVDFNFTQGPKGKEIFVNDLENPRKHYKHLKAVTRSRLMEDGLEALKE